MPVGIVVHQNVWCSGSVQTVWDCLQGVSHRCY